MPPGWTCSLRLNVVLELSASLTRADLSTLVLMPSIPAPKHLLLVEPAITASGPCCDYLQGLRCIIQPSNLFHA